MDESLRTLQRAARAAPSDRGLRERLRAALLRLRAVDPAGAAAGLDELEGALATPLVLGEQGTGSGAGWRRVPLGPGLLLPPRPPAGEELQTAWEAPGVLRWLSAGLALLETGEGGLEARRPADGHVLWRVPGERPLPEVEAWEDEPLSRAAWLGWAVAPWGAAALSARWEAQGEQRRVGRWTPRGRTTERARVGRGRVQVEVELRLLVGEGGRLSATPPEEVRERAGPGEELLETIGLEDWHDELLALSLDPLARQLAIRWRDEAEDWAVFLVLGDATSRATVGPAGWSAPPPHDPFAPDPPRGDPPGLAPPLESAALAGLVSGRKLLAGGPPADEGEAGLVIMDERLWLQLGTERLVVLA